MADETTNYPAAQGGAVDLSGLAANQPDAAGAAPGAPAQNAAPLAQVDDVVINGGEQELDEFARLSTRMPVLVEMHASWSHESRELSPVLESIVREAGGRLLLLRLDLDAHSQLGNQPQVIGLFGGQPMPLFSGNPPREQIVQVINELLQAAASRGLDGFVEVGDAEAAEPSEPPLPPLHQAAQEALALGDYAAAKKYYEQALTEAPADDLAKVGLAQVNLLGRLQGKTLAEVRERGAEAPDDLDAQFDVADLDLSGGHVDDAFSRLLNLYPRLDDEGKSAVRDRLLELFDVVGAEDARVKRARQRLTSLLFA